MSQPSDDRSRQAIAYSWASRIISICLEMILPGVAGFWLDRKLGTRFVFTVAGFGLGLTLGMMHLLQIARGERPGPTTRPTDQESTER